MEKITLESSDGEKFVVDIEVAKYFGTIKNLLECLFLSNEECLPLPAVKGSTLRLVLEWAQYHKDAANTDAEEESKKNDPDNISAWNRKFLNVSSDVLDELIAAAEYLDIDELTDAADKILAKMNSKNGRMV